MKILRFITIALISITLLGLELIWTRIFSAEYFYAFAFLILSLAIMGLGLGALTLRLVPALSRDKGLGISLTLAGLMALVSPPAVTALGMDFSKLFSSSAMLGKFVLVILLLGSAFFFGGAALAHLFRKYHQDMPRLYMVDLIGAGVGVMAALLMMNLLGTPSATFLTAVPILIAAALNCRAAWKTAPGILIVAALFLPSHAESILEVKREEPAPVIYKHWDATSKLKMYAFEGSYRGLNIDNVANTPIVPFDGDFGALDTIDLGWDIPVGYLIAKFDSCVFLSLGSGGGGDVLQALDDQAAEIYAVEVNPQINRLMTEEDTCGYIELKAEPVEEVEAPVAGSDSSKTTDSGQVAGSDSAGSSKEEAEAEEPPPPVIRDSTGRIITCAELSGHIYANPKVKVFTEDARAFVKRYRDKFDIIYSWSSNSWAALASGSFALAENYLFTQEAFMDYWRAMSDSGFLCLEHQMYMPRLVTEVMDALAALGVEDPTSHFAVYTLPQARRKVLLLSKQPLTEEIINNAFGPLALERAEQIHLIYPAPDSLKNSIYNRIITEGWQAASDSAKIDLSPCTDNRPFIAQLGLWKNFGWDKLEKISNYAEFTGFPLARLIIFVILLVVVVLILPLNLIPYLIKGPHLRAVPWLYFFAIGMAFMMIEVVLIQKYTLYIGASVYSIATVLLTLLIGSGIGSRFANRVSEHTVFLAIVVWLILDLTLFGFITGALDQLTILPRALVAAVLLLPLGFFMGMPFPKGTLRVGELIDWGFSVNGAASVFGGTLIVLIAFSYGFTAALVCGGLTYLAAYTLISMKSAW